MLPLQWGCGKLSERVGRKTGRLKSPKDNGRPDAEIHMKKRNLLLLLALVSLFLPVTSVRGEVAVAPLIQTLHPSIAESIADSVLLSPADRLPTPHSSKKTADQ